MEILQPSWRGKNLSTRKDSCGKYMAMLGTDALLYVPVKIEKNAVYRVQIEASRISGNGITYCNIYGNRNFDFPQSSFTCDSSDWTIYTIEIQTRSFPNTVPMKFRIWRKPNGNGTLLIRRIVVEMVSMENEGIPTKIANNMPIDSEGNIVKKEIVGPVDKIQNEINLPIHRKKKIERKELKDLKLVPKRAPRKQAPARRRRRGTVVQKAIGVPELTPGVDGIKNSVIISLKDRADFLDRTLYTYDNQTMDKKEFEIIIMDDNSKEDILGVCKKHSNRSGLKFQYFKIDGTKGAIEQKGFTPALSNNIGFKNARGAVLIVAGPESLQSEHNMEYSWERCKEVRCIYGVCHRSNAGFVDILRSDPNWYKKSFDEIMSIRGAQAAKADLTGFWWYFVAVRKEYMLHINGVDERYMLGISAEDDDLAERMKVSGVPLEHDRRILSIHQDHSREDKNHPNHMFRFNKKEWNRLRNHNCRLLSTCVKCCEPIVNVNIDWGTSRAILYWEIF